MEIFFPKSLGRITVLNLLNLKNLNCLEVACHVNKKMRCVPVEVSELPLLILEHVECLLHPRLEGGHLRAELGQLVHGRLHALEQLVRVVGHRVISERK